MMLKSYPLKEGTVQHITADKGEVKDSPKLPLATSFIRKTLCKKISN